MKEDQNKIQSQDVEQSAVQSEKAYVLNKGLPRFVGRTEIKRLSQIIEEKNAAIEAFKKYDEERKEYYKDIQNLVDRLESENDELKKENVKLQANMEKLRKKQEPMFAPELRELMESGDMTATEYEKFMNLYAYWLQHRNDVIFYKSRLKTGRSSVKTLKKDLQSIKTILSNAGKMDVLERLSERMLNMTSHLDTLQQRLSSGVEEISEDIE